MLSSSPTTSQLLSLLGKEWDLQEILHFYTFCKNWHLVKGEKMKLSIFFRGKFLGEAWAY